MTPLSAAELQELTLNAEVLEKDGLGPKVLHLSDGSFLKLFRKRRLLSSETLKPYARRFAENAKKLRELGFITPEIIKVYRLENDINGTAVRYTPLPGNTLRHALQQVEAEQQSTLINQLGQLLSLLHEKGVYFRSAHLGNVLLLPDGTLGLIDIADLKIQRTPLSLAKRLRNLKHMRRYKQDTHWLFESHKHALIAGYTLHSAKYAQSLFTEIN